MLIILTYAVDGNNDCFNSERLFPLTLSPKGEGDRLFPLPSGERIEVRGVATIMLSGATKTGMCLTVNNNI